MAFQITDKESVNSVSFQREGSFASNKMNHITESPFTNSLFMEWINEFHHLLKSLTEWWLRCYEQQHGYVLPTVVCYPVTILVDNPQAACLFRRPSCHSASEALEIYLKRILDGLRQDLRDVSEKITCGASRSEIVLSSHSFFKLPGL